MESQPQLSQMESDMLTTRLRSSNAAREIARREQQALNELVTLMDDRHGTNIAGGVHQLTEEGYIVERPQGPQVLNED